MPVSVSLGGSFFFSSFGEAKLHFFLLRLTLAELHSQINHCIQDVASSGVSCFE